MDSITRRTALGAGDRRSRCGGISALGASRPTTEIELFYPVPVQGMLANKMKELIDRFNGGHEGVKVTAVYTGSYDDTNLKARAAIKTGKPRGAVIMSANFVREYVINDEVEPFDPIIEKAGGTATAYFDDFWPALKPNAVIDGKVFGIPFQNSTPLLYYNVEAFAEAGLNPDRPPASWFEWIDAAKALTKVSGTQTDRCGLMFPATYDYCGWITSGLVMANGGQYFNHDYGGPVAELCPRQYKTGLQGCVPPAQRAQRGADRRRLVSCLRNI
jgi:sn-glycerol 3-phosphate transport system substrate-binding protein